MNRSLYRLLVLAVVASIGLLVPVGTEAYQTPSTPIDKAKAEKPDPSKDLIKRVHHLRTQTLVAKKVLAELKKAEQTPETRFKIHIVELLIESDGVNLLPAIERAAVRYRAALGKRCRALNGELSHKQGLVAMAQGQIDRVAELIVQYERALTSVSSDPERSRELASEIDFQKGRLDGLVKMREESKGVVDSITRQLAQYDANLGKIKGLSKSLDRVATLAKDRVARLENAIDAFALHQQDPGFAKTEDALHESLEILTNQFSDELTLPLGTPKVRVIPLPDFPTTPRTAIPPSSATNKLIEAELEKARARFQNGPSSPK